MLLDLTEDERLLAELMSDISERCYHAGWMKNLEYAVWNAVILGPRVYGQDKITLDDIEELNRRANQVGAWIYFDDEMEETTLSLDKWKVKFAHDVSQDPDRIQG